MAERRLEVLLAGMKPELHPGVYAFCVADQRPPDAVGFLAEVAARLAAAGISCNVFSAVHHDHLFVPHGRGADALAALRTR